MHAIVHVVASLSRAGDKYYIWWLHWSRAIDKPKAPRILVKYSQRKPVSSEYARNRDWTHVSLNDLNLFKRLLECEAYAAPDCLATWL